MWEWSKRILKKKRTTPKAKSLLAAYTDLLNKTAASPEGSSPQKKRDIAEIDTHESSVSAPKPEEMRRLLELKIQEFGLKNITLREFAYDPQTWAEMNNIFPEYLRAREVFLKLLGYSCAEECTAAGLTPDDLNLLKQTHVPENMNTHLKVPFDFGGTLDFENFSLIQTHPCHGMIHRLIDFQIENNYLRVYKKIYLPWFEGKIYHD